MVEMLQSDLRAYQAAGISCAGRRNSGQYQRRILSASGLGYH